MADNVSNTVAAVNEVATSISSNDHGYTPPQQSNWKACWSGLLCFRSQRREKRVAPASRLGGAFVSSREWQSNGLAQGVLALAPPSSPVSFVNSSVQSPANFSLALSTASVNMCSPPLNPMFMIGPYAHETQLVSPPVFSTFTTEPSTAPFTPPPELAHLTTPSSPDVPFAELLASSLEAKASAREPVSPFSGSSIASPCDFPSNDLQFAYQVYPESPVGHLVSTTPCISRSGTCSPVPIMEMSGRCPSRGSYVSTFPKFGSFTSFSNDQPPCAKLVLPETSLLLSGDEVDGPRFSLGCRSDLRSHSDITSETDPKVPVVNTDNCGLFQNKIAEDKNRKVRDCNSREGGLLPGFVVNEPAQSNWQIFRIGLKKECPGRSWKTKDFVKIENKGTERWVQLDQGCQGCTVDLNASKGSYFEPAELVSQVAEGTGAEPAERSYHTSVEILDSDTACLLLDLECYEEELDQPGNDSKQCMHSGEATACRCRELAISCS